MAFDLESFTLNRGTINSVTGPTSVAIHAYKTLDDILTVLASGYFNDVSSGLVVGDLIYACATTSTAEVPRQFLLVSGTNPVTTQSFL